MATLCGRLKLIGDTAGYGKKYEQDSDTGRWHSTDVKLTSKLAIVFGDGTSADLRADDQIIGDVTAVTETLAYAIAEAPVGEQVCFFYYKHLLRRMRLVGYRSASGKS